MMAPDAHNLICLFHLRRHERHTESGRRHELTAHERPTSTLPSRAKYALVAAMMRYAHGSRRLASMSAAKYYRACFAPHFAGDQDIISPSISAISHYAADGRRAEGVYLILSECGSLYETYALSLYFH